MGSYLFLIFDSLLILIFTDFHFPLSTQLVDDSRIELNPQFCPIYVIRLVACGIHSPGLPVHISWEKQPN